MTSSARSAENTRARCVRHRGEGHFARSQLRLLCRSETNRGRSHVFRALRTMEVARFSRARFASRRESRCPHRRPEAALLHPPGDPGVRRASSRRSALLVTTSRGRHQGRRVRRRPRRPRRAARDDRGDHRAIRPNRRAGVSAQSTCWSTHPPGLACSPARPLSATRAPHASSSPSTCCSTPRSP